MKHFLALSVLAAPAFAGQLEIITDADGNRSLKSLGSATIDLEAAAQAMSAAANPSQETVSDKKNNLRRLSGKDSSSTGTKERDLQQFFGKGEETDEPTPVPTAYDNCFTVQYVAMVSDIIEYSKKTAVGTTYWFPVYDPYLMKPVGIYTEESTETHYDECVTSGAFLFEYQEGDGTYDSMINTASTCTSTFSSLTGGAGKFRCARGYQIFEDYTDSSKLIKTTLSLCDTPCFVEDKPDDEYDDN